MADCRVAGGHVVKAMDDLRLRTAVDVRHRAACDEPHHELDALAAGLTHVIEVWDLGQRRRLVDQAIEKALVPLLVDQPRPRPLQLVAHAAGTPDLHVERLVVTFYGPANGLPELEAASPGGRRILNDVHSEGDHPTGPGRGLTTH